jgi:hypothetical protein
MIIQAKQLTNRTLFRLLYTGLTISLFIIVCVLAIIVLCSGRISFSTTVTIGDKELPDAIVVIVALLLFPVITLGISAIVWFLLWIGLSIYSIFRKTEFEFIEAELIAPMSKQTQQPRQTVTPDDIRIEDYLPDDYEEHSS